MTASLTASAVQSGLDALSAQLLLRNVGLDARQSYTTSKAANRRALRATNPFKTPFLSSLFPVLVPRPENKSENWL